ncbi:MAG: hypothetical protein JWN14_305 [Chthonomonadales bacterium]|nr:hypothetical protein [Chthonomonadales bacterium]
MHLVQFAVIETLSIVSLLCGHQPAPVELVNAQFSLALVLPCILGRFVNVTRRAGPGEPCHLPKDVGYECFGRLALLLRQQIDGVGGFGRGP